MGRQSCQARVWESDQSVFKAWLCRGSSSRVTSAAPPPPAKVPRTAEALQVRSKGHMRAKPLHSLAPGKQMLLLTLLTEAEKGEAWQGPRALPLSGQLQRVRAPLPGRTGNTEHLLYAPSTHPALHSTPPAAITPLSSLLPQPARPRVWGEGGGPQGQRVGEARRSICTALVLPGERAAMGAAGCVGGGGGGGGQRGWG